jgi:iron(III) transport system ATP-binding protein
MSTVHIRSVTKSFGTTPVLDAVDLDIEGGALTAVLGPSGCGKTTLLRIIAGFVHPDAGTVTFDGERMSGPGVHVAPQRRRVGYVAQEGALFPHLDVAANIAFGLPRRGRRASPRVAEMLDLIGLPAAMAGRFPHELSGGQQQRVAVARALAPEPSIVLLDEPFASLDAGLREGTGRAVAEVLRASGATAVLVTHDQSEALSLATNVAVMREGRIVQADTPQTVYHAPADAAVAAFVGGSVLLPATIRDGVAQCALGRIDVKDAVDGEMLVLIRPEQVELGPAAGPLGVTATVAGVSFFGHDADVRLALDEDGPEIVARVHGGAVPARGEQVRLSVRGPAAAYAESHAALLTG